MSLPEGTWGSPTNGARTRGEWRERTIRSELGVSIFQNWSWSYNQSISEFPNHMIDDMMEFTKYFWGCRCGYFRSSHAIHGKPAWVKILRTPITFLGRWALMGFFETRGYHIKIGWFLLAKWWSTVPLCRCSPSFFRQARHGGFL